MAYPSVHWRSSNGRRSIRQHLTSASDVSIRQHTSAYVSIRQHTSAYVTSATGAVVRSASRAARRTPMPHTPGSLRPHTPTSLRPHTLVAWPHTLVEALAELLAALPCPIAPGRFCFIFNFIFIFIHFIFKRYIYINVYM